MQLKDQLFPLQDNPKSPLLRRQAQGSTVAQRPPEGSRSRGGSYGSDTDAREGQIAVVPFFGGGHDDSCFEVSKVSAVKGRQ